MIKGAKSFTNFVNIALKVLLFLIVCITFERFCEYARYKIHPFNTVLIIAVLILGTFLYIAIKKNCKPKIILISIMLVALVLRIVWIMWIKSHPMSDFRLIYSCGGKFLEGDYSAFKGTSYIARFPHLTIPVLYFAAIQKIFTHHLMATKILNCIYSTVNVLLIYKIAKEVFNSEKRALWGAYITAIYPPLITYTSVCCTENMAIPFYLTSIYYFILVVREKRDSKWLILSALILALGNLFRRVAAVMIIAYLMYLLIYTQKSLKQKAKNCGYILMAFLVPIVLTSSILKASNITEFHLWKGSEPSLTSILKGTNISSFGRWNEEDAELFDKYDRDYEKVSKACKEEIKKRLTQTPKDVLAFFYLTKFTFQWREGDFSGIYWAKLGIEDSFGKMDPDKVAFPFMQFMYFILVLLTYIGLYNKNQYNKNPIINLFYIIYCGYGVFYLITESQDRYSFIVCWLFLILALASSERIKLWRD